ncbi:MAG TPA: hypothetical protein P5277_00410 [Candidatus Paceibacterota bacterium]|nr:hypothetical protein [Candidatus Paceibacterota bacterium]
MKVKNLILGLAITILASFVAIYGIKAFYGDTPVWDDYCEVDKISVPQVEINTSAKCEELGGNWNSLANSAKFEAMAIPGVSGYCDFYYECQQEFDEAQKSYSKNLFLITIPVGVVLIVIGAVLFSLEAIGAGIMLAGIVTLIFGATSYWPNANNIFRFLISLAGLVIVIFIGYWINREIAKEGKLKKLMKKIKK